MDFIDQLPLSGTYDAILVIVCLTKMALFIPTTTKITSVDLALIFIDRVFAKHGTPVDIVSDRGSKFTSEFWRAFSKAVGVRQSFTTAYHPEADGQTERVNQLVETYLRMYIGYDQDDWSKYLPLAKFAYNNTPHSPTSMLPFFASYGFHPLFNIDMVKTTKSSHGVTLANLRKLHLHAKEEILKAQDKQQRDANPSRLQHPEELFRVGQHIWLSTKDLKRKR